MNKNVKYEEYKFVIQVTSKDEQDELMYVKALQTYEDGTKEIVIKKFYNYERPYFITKEKYRDHEFKKESESRDKVLMKKSTDLNLVNSISKTLYGRPAAKYDRLTTLNRSPYVYGTDISGSAFLKGLHRMKNPESYEQGNVFTVSTFDFETDVLNVDTDDTTNNDDREPTLCTCKFQEHILLIYMEDKYKHILNPEEKIMSILKVRVEEIVGKDGKNDSVDNYKIKLVKTKTDLDMMTTIRDFWYEHKPDFITAYNIKFDLMEVIVPVLLKYNIDPGEFLADPSLPNKFKVFKPDLGRNQKVTASGRTSALGWHERFFTFNVPAPFRFICTGQAYHKDNLGRPEPPNWKLNTILAINGITTKMTSVPGTEHLKDLAWHQEMQRKYPIEYAVYNVGDTLLLDILLDRINLLNIAIPERLMDSDLKKLPSNPGRIADKLFFNLLSRGRVFGCTSDQMVLDIDKILPNKKDWIVSLPCTQFQFANIELFHDMPKVYSQITPYSADSDVSASYPNSQIAANLSRDTTRLEVGKIQGISDIGFRSLGIAIASGGNTNAVMIAKNIYNASEFSTLIDAYTEEVLKES